MDTGEQSPIIGAPLRTCVDPDRHGPHGWDWRPGPDEPEEFVLCPGHRRPAKRAPTEGRSPQ